MSAKIFKSNGKLYQEVIEEFINDSGEVESKISVEEIESAHSDFWRSHYHTEELPEDAEEKTIYLLNKCLTDLSRIVNTFDPTISLAYKNKKMKYNDINNSKILLDPKFAISEEKALGNKIDVFAGEILLGAVYRKQNEETRQSYKHHMSRLLNPQSLDIEKATSLLFLAMETDAASQEIQEKTPGFLEYARARAKAYEDPIKSKKLSDIFKTTEPKDINDSARFAALLREFDTFNSIPLDYGSFNNVVSHIIKQVRGLPSSESRLAAARQIAKKFVANISNQNGEGEGEFNLESLQDLLSSSDMLGKMQEDSSDAEDSEEGEEGEGIDEDDHLGKILDDMDQFSKTTALLTEKVKYKLNDLQAKELYEADAKDVLQVSSAIEESLNILNHEQKSWDEYSLRRGEIDEGSFYKLADNSDNVFYQEETLPKMKIQVGILLDESLSMDSPIQDEEGNVLTDNAQLALGYGNHLTRSGIARKLATAFLEGTKNIKGVDLYIYGHAAPNEDCIVYKYIDRNTPEDSFYRVAHVSARLYNLDGYAIAKAGEDMLSYDSEESYTKKLLFILSDGEPSAAKYKGNSARKHIKDSISNLNEAGIETYAIGVANAFTKSTGDYMYGENKHIVFSNFILSQVAIVISSFLEEVCKNQ